MGTTVLPLAVAASGVAVAFRAFRASEEERRAQVTTLANGLIAFSAGNTMGEYGARAVKRPLRTRQVSFTGGSNHHPCPSRRQRSLAAQHPRRIAIMAAHSGIHLGTKSLTSPRIAPLHIGAFHLMA